MGGGGKGNLSMRVDSSGTTGLICRSAAQGIASNEQPTLLIYLYTCRNLPND
jgi:hypothetical protein